MGNLICNIRDIRNIRNLSSIRNIRKTCLALWAVMLLLPCMTVYAADKTFEDIGVQPDSITVIYTNDIHGGISNEEPYSGSSKSLGLHGVAALRQEAADRTAGVTLVDLGDAIQGSIVCSQSKGEDMIRLMNQAGYDFQIPGNHEFDFGTNRFLELMGKADAKYLAVNFENLRTHSQIMAPYAMVSYDVDGRPFKVAYIGIVTPENISKGVISNFQDDSGNYIYSFYGEDLNRFYQAIQGSIDSARREGADYVVALGHLGDEGITPGWSSVDVIQNTRGIGAFLDGHAHSVLEQRICRDLDGKDVLLSSTGTKLENIGVLTIQGKADGTVAASTHLVNRMTDREMQLEAYKETKQLTDSIQQQYGHLIVKEGTSPYSLYIYAPDTGKRLVRNQETNLGDFITDAFRYGLNADVAFSAGGNIRADLESGDITYLDIMNVLPWDSIIVKLEVTGQQLLDCLEMGSRLWPEQCGGFMQTSGLTYEILTDRESSVVTTEDGLFKRVDGEYRVRNVQVGNEALDLNRTYTLAIDKYYYQSDGDGMTMFKECNALVKPEDRVLYHDLIIKYLSYLGGTVPAEYKDVNGQGRIRLVKEGTVSTEGGAKESMLPYMVRAAACAQLYASLISNTN